LAEAVELSALLRAAGRCVVLTGAGVSTESGIPDFRSPTGIWAQYDPREYATIEAFEKDPEKVWSFYSLRYRALTEAEPNDAHRALAELERRGFVSALITQNIDLLHERAGSRDVIEVHGSIRECVCLSDGTRYGMDDVLRMLDEGEVPRCTSCGSVLKPGVVMFGELLDAAAIDRAFELAREAKLLLVVGSTLEVQPVAGLPWETVTAGGDVAIVNLGPTAFDHRAALKIDGKAGAVLREVVELLGPTPPRA
jgi:NAD-dependent protein deacetylase/lipoamidase